MVPVEVGSVVLQSAGWAQTVSNAENLVPVLLSSALCANVVLKVSWTEPLIVPLKHKHKYT